MICKVDQGTALADRLLTFVEGCSWVEAKEHIAEMIRSWAFSDWETMFAAILDGKIVGMAAGQIIYSQKTSEKPLPACQVTRPSTR